MRLWDDWLTVASGTFPQAVRSLAIYNDGTGDAIFGGTGRTNGGTIVKYNSTLRRWLTVAPNTGYFGYLFFGFVE